MAHKFFLWSDSGEAAFMLERLQREGHKVRMYAKDKNAKDVYRGIIPLTSSTYPTKDEVVLFDMVGFGSRADSLRSGGIRVVGASKLADLMELDRTLGTSMMKEVGIRTPETHSFKDLKQGIAFLSGKPGIWFYKPYGNQDAGLTDGGDADYLIRFMEGTASKYKPKGFELQKKVDGTEISLEGWFDGRRFVYPWNSTVEDKKLLSKDLGPRTGCMCNVVWAYEDPRTPLAINTVHRLEHLLAKFNYVGPIDLNMILDRDGVAHGLEWSARFGYDAIQALSLLIQGDLGDQLEAFSRGKLDAFNVDMDNLSFTLGLSTPPFPYHALAQEYKGTLLDPELKRDPHHVMLRDAMIDQYGRVMLSGMDGYVATIGKCGQEIGSLREEVLELVGKFKIPSPQYRPDPVMRYEKVVSELSRLGYDTFRPNAVRRIGHAQ